MTVGAQRSLGVTGEHAEGSLAEAVAAGAGWRPLLLLGALSGGVLAEGAVLLLAPSMAPALGRSVGSVGHLLGLWSLGLVLGFPFALRAALGRHRILAAGLGGCLMAAAMAAIAVAGNGLTVALGALVAGVGAVVSAGTHRSLLSDLYPPLALSHVLSAARATGLVAGSVALAVAFPLVAASDLSWRGALLIIAAGVAVPAVAITIQAEPTRGHHETSHVQRLVGGVAAEAVSRRLGFGESLRRLVTIPTVRPTLAVIGVVGAVGYGDVVFGGYALAERGGLSVQAVAGVVLVAAAAAAVALLAVADRAASDLRRDPAQLTRQGAWSLALAGGATAVLGTSPWAPVAAGALLVATAALACCLTSTDRLLLLVVPAELRGVVGAVAAIYAGGLGVGVGGALLASVEGSGGLTVALPVLGLVGVVGGVALRSVAKGVAADVAGAAGGLVEAAESATALASGARPPLLTCRGINFSYGPLQILFDVDFTVDDGEMVALLGTNGAGKSTLLRVVSGLGTPSSGTVRIAGEDVTFAEPGYRVRAGVSQIPGGKAVFGPLSVVDNLRLYGYSLGRDRASIDRGLDEAFETFPRLAERRNSLASTMSGGEQQMLALSKALILRPRLLLIDELSLGLAPKVVGELLTLVRSINAKGTSVVLVEQSVNVALSLAQHAYFMEKGQVRFDGKTADLLARPDIVRSVFLAGVAAGAPS